MIRLLGIFPGIVPGDDPLAVDMRTGFMGTGEVDIELDQLADRQFGQGVEEDAAATDIEGAGVKGHTLVHNFGADQAGTAAFANSGEKTAAYFQKAVAVEGLVQYRLTAGKKAFFLFAGFADHDNRDLAQCRVGLDLQTALRPRHTGDLLGEIDELRFFCMAEGDGLSGALGFKKGHWDVAEKLLLYGQEESRFIDQQNLRLTLFHAVALQGQSA